MYTSFCYCCKQHITSLDENEFHKEGHVNNPDQARTKYHINANRLMKDVK